MKNLRQRGATLIEFILASAIIIFAAYGTIEITHMLTFKGKLSTIAVDVSQQIVHQHLYLQRLYQTQGADRVNAWLGQETERLVQRYFAAVEHTAVAPGLRVKPKIVLTTGANRAGFYLQVEACYSFLFARSLSDSNFAIGTGPFILVPQGNRNCFGEFSRQPVPQMQLFERVYTPWPANSQVYKYGVPEGGDVVGIEPPTTLPASPVPTIPFPGFTAETSGREEYVRNSNNRNLKTVNSKNRVITSIEQSGTETSGLSFSEISN